MKIRTIVTIDYNHYLLPEGNSGELLGAFSQMIKVRNKGYGKDEIFIPEEEIPCIEFKMVLADRVRVLTTEEKEQDRIKELESGLEFQKTQREKLQKEIEELKCINKALCEKEPETPRE